MYRYRLRPGYRSDELLIELLPDSADDVFFGELRTVLKQVNAKLDDEHDIWMNDEVLLIYESDYGPFNISSNVWDMVFIMSHDNQTAIEKIEEALSQSSRFWRETVDYSEYR